MLQGDVLRIKANNKTRMAQALLERCLTYGIDISDTASSRDGSEISGLDQLCLNDEFGLQLREREYVFLQDGTVG